MNTVDVEHHRRRSEFIRKLIHSRLNQAPPAKRFRQRTPSVVVQYWHDKHQIPPDVYECIQSWKSLAARQVVHRLFDRESARKYIRCYLGSRFERAFRRCYHPAMEADYFRLCFLSMHGGIYVDADDLCVTEDVGGLLEDGRLRVQPLCYDRVSGEMVDSSHFLEEGNFSPEWTYYFNNNPLVCAPGHPIVSASLAQATNALSECDGVNLPEIQDTTGPGNLTKTVLDIGERKDSFAGELVVLEKWETYGVTQWPLSYRNDSRNWRLSNRQAYSQPRRGISP